MIFRNLEYQHRVLQQLHAYLSELTIHKTKADKITDANAKQADVDLRIPDYDFPAETWESLKSKGKIPLSRRNIPYSSRTDGIGRAVPNIVYKVPTGGGKTYLAVRSLIRIFHAYLGSTRGLILWIMPNEAIYRQTKRNLSNRRHPCRQLLDNFSINSLKIMEKNTPLHAADVDNNLCLMLLMLQSSNRENKETLKIFQERGDCHGFTPDEGNQQAHQHMHAQIHNLDRCDLADGNPYPWMPIKDSLGNALRIIRPVVVMDEGHKAVSDLAFKTLYGFNPSFVLELTATPKDVRARHGKNPQPARYQNVLVEISGVDLDKEGMIKMPLNLDSRQSIDWKNTISAAVERLRELTHTASAYQADTGHYIRPILVVQVERTGKDQRDGKHVHAHDVQEWLTTVGNFDRQQIAIKTAEQNDLDIPENHDLLHEKSRVRIIITKQALQEGWDCPFAYILCSLAASSNLSAMTQLVGRILRQPHAQKTDVPLLDQCYVITHHANTGTVIENIKKGLEEDGMGDLVQHIHVDTDGAHTYRTIQRSPQFAKTNIVLPKVLCNTADGLRDLDYEQDILYRLDWSNVDVGDLVKNIPKDPNIPERQVHTLSVQEQETGQLRIRDEFYRYAPEIERFDCAYIAHAISDIVPNAWRAYSIVHAVRDELLQDAFSTQKLDRYCYIIIEYLRSGLSKQRAEMAEQLFRNDAQNGRIQFHLQADGYNWVMPKDMRTAHPDSARHLPGDNGRPLQRTLFSPVYHDDLNDDERKIAVYLDSNESLHWWHRNVSKQQYFVQGWRRDKIYPDFIFALRCANNRRELVILEAKGEHLSGNPDTEYKKAVLQLMSESFARKETVSIGDMELLHGDGTIVRCEMILMPEWLNGLLHCMECTHAD